MFSIYSGKRVFVTGHTGFKGSWLISWLELLGAEVAGYSLPPESNSHFNVIKTKCKSYFDNINNFQNLKKALDEFKPDIVFHLAAQPLVIESYRTPIETYETNVIGSLKVYKACLESGVKAIVSITTDKVYENREWCFPYRENDRLGGYDPYSSSKACVEVMTDSFRRSFLSDNKMLLATTRAGNVIGGGDWAENRIVPDLIRSAQSKVEIEIRNPNSIRPWQHVLEPLRGYLIIGEKLLNNGVSYSKAYNFGPDTQEAVSVEQICKHMKANWEDICYYFKKPVNDFHEAGILKLDISLSQSELNWQPVFDFKNSLDYTVDWYKSFHYKKEILTVDQIKSYMELVPK